MLTGDLRFFVANVVVRWRMTLPALSAVSLVPDVEVGVEVMKVRGLVAALFLDRGKALLKVVHGIVNPLHLLTQALLDSVCLTSLTMEVLDVVTHNLTY